MLAGLQDRLWLSSEATAYMVLGWDAGARRGVKLGLRQTMRLKRRLMSCRRYPALLRWPACRRSFNAKLKGFF